MTFRNLAYGASAVAIMMSASTAAFAQETTGGVAGGVYDASGAPIAGGALLGLAPVQDRHPGAAQRAVRAGCGG